jgi:serine/threonine protein kinase, bacterial
MGDEDVRQNPGATAPASSSASGRKRLASIVAAVAVVVLGIGVVLGRFMVTTHEPDRSAPATSAAPPSDSLLDAPHHEPTLNGTYEFDYDDGGITAPSWWAFRSWCDSGHCQAAGVKLDATNHAVADTVNGGLTDTLTYEDGKWSDSGKLLPGTTCEAYGHLTMTPQPGGEHFIGIITREPTTGCGPLAHV